MSSPQNGTNFQHATTEVGSQGSYYIDSLVAGVKWGGGAGMGTTLTYSFPWAITPTASWATSPSYSSLNEPSRGSGLTASQQAILKQVMATWSNVANITFTEVVETSSNVGDIRVAWTAKTDGRAIAWAMYPDDYWASGGDVWLSQSEMGAEKASSWNPNGYAYYALIHELGHAIGLKHSFEDSPTLPYIEDSAKYTIMSYTAAPNDVYLKVTPTGNGQYSFDYADISPETPMLYDIAAIQYLYGPNLSYKTGDDIYSFDPATPFFRTLWDAGGVDTVTVANFSKGCIIDLNPGRYSKITIESDPIPPGYTGGTQPTYDGTDNLAIAYGAVIENATGGSGADNLVGNTANNILTGGGGNDTLIGGAGNDTIDGGDGSDTMVLTGNFADYAVTYAAATSTFTIADKTGNRDGSDTVRGVENFKFADAAKAAAALVNTGPGSVIVGTSGNDTLVAGSGNDTIDGGAGIDTAAFSGGKASYAISRTTSFLVQENQGLGALHTLVNVERLQFSDSKMAFDMAGSAGNTAQVITAAFGKATLSNKQYVGIGLSLFDAGQSMEQVAQLAIGTGLVSAPDNASFVRAVWLNVVGTPIDASNLATYTALLDNQAYTQPSLLAMAAQTAAAQAQADIVGLSSRGLEFI